MSKEQYVTHETSQLLKEKGFDWAVLACYQNSEFRYVNIGNWNKFSASTLCSAPTQQMACRWLRETQGLWIIPMPCEDGGCYFKIYKRYGKIWKDNVYGHTDYEDFDEPEEAIEAALEYVLTNLI